METKTDNKDPRAKLELRRHFLRRYHADGDLHVFDCCQATGLLWRTLRSEFPVKKYWGVDLKEKPGRLKIDSVRILEQPGLEANVIDVDTYGSPWKHWAAILQHQRPPLTIFLTIGQVSMGTDKLILQTLGLGRLKIPPGIAVKLHERGLQSLLGLAGDRGSRILECQEATGSPSKARYLGLRLAAK